MKALTVKQLKELLADMDDDRIVVLQKDSEGNGYEPVRGVDDNAVWDEYHDTVKYQKITPSMRKKGYTKGDAGKGQKAVVLYP